MPNVLIIHGAYGHPKENWFPWLKTELDRMTCKTIVPQFPTPEGQNLENWMRAFEPYRKQLDKYSMVVGHSLGVPFLLSVIEGLEKPIKAAFFVSGFVGPFTGKWADPELDEMNRTFTEREFNWQRIRQNCAKFYVFHGEDDLLVPLQKAKELANNLGVAPLIVKYAGHFNEKSGYTRFDLLLEKMKKEL